MIIGEEYCEDLIHERIIHMSSVKYCDAISDYVIHGMSLTTDYN